MLHYVGVKSHLTGAFVVNEGVIPHATVELLILVWIMT